MNLFIQIVQFYFIYVNSLFAIRFNISPQANPTINVKSSIFIYSSSFSSLNVLNKDRKNRPATTIIGKIRYFLSKTAIQPTTENIWYLIFAFCEAPEKFRASKDFRLHPHNFCDRIKLIWVSSPMRMTFYSTQFLW